MSEFNKQDRTEDPTDTKAIALRYNTAQDSAPVVIASGYGEIAENIINIAEQRGIPVYRDDSAASLLCMLGVGANIPEELYEVVSAIYAQMLMAASHIQRNDPGPLHPETQKGKRTATPPKKGETP